MKVAVFLLFSACTLAMNLDQTFRSIKNDTFSKEEMYEETRIDFRQKIERANREIGDLKDKLANPNLTGIVRKMLESRLNAQMTALDTYLTLVKAK